MDERTSRRISVRAPAMASGGEVPPEASGDGVAAEAALPRARPSARPAARASVPPASGAASGQDGGLTEKKQLGKKKATKKKASKKKATKKKASKKKATKKKPRVVVEAAGQVLELPQGREANAGRRSEPPPPSSPPPPPELSTLLEDVSGAESDGEARRRAAEAIGRIAARLYPDAASRDQADDRLSGARQLLSTEYYVRRWTRIAMRGRSERVDDFGLDRAYEARIKPLLDFLYDHYFRVEVDGLEHLPEQGAALLVCNRGGALPWDGVMLKTAIGRHRGGARELRWLVEDFAFHAPFLGATLNRAGAVRACPENAERLLARGELLAVFPEGVKGVEKLYSERYQLQRFGRGGHVKLALRLGVPMLPVAIVGAEESYPLLYRVRAFSRALGVPFIPVTPTFPWLGPLGALPLPSRWRIRIGPPVQDLDGLPAETANHSLRVNELNERVRNQVQQLLEGALRDRGPGAYV
ncbi:MAG: acyltransferase family protein [Myxococcales bacterium]|nr:acyltransferase family protein [Myxococcales bacterium]